jgi:signal transduction histidine kinase
MRGPVTVRARTTLLAVVVVGLALAVGAVSLVASLRWSLERNVTDAARLRAHDVAALAARSGIPNPLSFPGDDKGMVQIVAPDGTVVASSSNMQGEPPIAQFPIGISGSAVRTLTSLSIGDGERFRVVGLSARTPSGPAVVYAAQSLDAVDHSVNTATTALAIGTPILVAIVGLTTWMVVGRALRPVESIRAEVAEIGDTDLHRRAPEPGTADEIGRLAVTMNAMLDRLEQAAERQRRFVADASHELRSPLASMRAQLEANLLDPSSSDWVATTIDVLDDQARLEQLVADLLLLARLDSRRSLRPPAVVDVSAAVNRAIRRYGVTRVPIDLQAMSKCLVLGHAEQIERLSRNLVDNALRHASTAVRVKVARVGTDVLIDVLDDGPGVAMDDRVRVFERFTRLDAARATDSGGSGLGLSIVERLVNAHGGRVAFLDSELGAHVRVTLPAVDHPSQPEAVETPREILEPVQPPH